MTEFGERLELVLSNVKRNHVVSVVSGCFIAIGWWIIIDVAVIYPLNQHFNHIFHIAGVLSTVGFLMLNSVSNAAVRGDSDYDGCCANAGPKIWFFIGCTLLFASIIVSCYIFFGIYLVTGKQPFWPGLAVFLQNVLIFTGSVIFKFARREE